jgi:hypothetical protein
LEIHAPLMISLHDHLRAAGGQHDHGDFRLHVSLSRHVTADFNLLSLTPPDFLLEFATLGVGPLPTRRVPSSPAKP